jgi:hypothetical protein
MSLRWVHEHHDALSSKYVAYEDGFGYCATVQRYRRQWFVARHKPPQRGPERVRSLAEGKRLAEADALGREGKR